MKKYIFLFIITIICWNCSFNADTDKFQQKRNNIIYVKNELQEIDLGDILVGQFARLYVMNDYLIISDARSFDKQINIFNINDFSYLASIAERGQGPNDITNLGFIGVNDKRNELYVSDHGKQLIYGYSLDSVFENPQHLPVIKMKMHERQFPNQYHVINDTTFMGVIIEPTGNSGYNQATAIINTNSNEIIPINYKHPKIERKIITFAMSEKHNIFIECYLYHDLMSIFNLDGSLKYNIYGRSWNSKNTNIYGYYVQVKICNDLIVASFSAGKDRYSNKEPGNPTQFLVFNIEGEYIKTLETECYIMDFCYDKQNNRLIMHLNDEMQFAFLDLNGLF